jgi:hypothetical protein
LGAGTISIVTWVEPVAAIFKLEATPDETSTIRAVEAGIRLETVAMTCC